MEICFLTPQTGKMIGEILKFRSKLFERVSFWKMTSKGYLPVGPTDIQIGRNERKQIF